MSEEQGIKINDIKMGDELKPSLSVAIDRTVLQDIIGTVGQSDNMSQSSDTNSDQTTAEKTNEDDTTEQTNSKTSRELKLLLALSKEANLDTNISRKRKTLEGKFKDKESSPKITASDSDSKKITKVAHENRNIRYPVTAEAELELEVPENEVKSVTDNSNKTSKRKRDGLSEVNVGGATEEVAKRTRKSLMNEITMFKTNKDMFCWRCHRENVNISCETCPRSYHQKCLKQTINDVDHWPCPECVAILKAESTQTRSEAMKGMTLEHLCSLLKFAVNRMIQCQGSEPFLHPVSDSEFPNYKKYIVQPIDLTKLEKNIKENLYGSTQAFEADAKWLLHNSIIFNSYQSKLTSSAKNIIKICKQEMAEVENCPSCYLNANTKKSTWFVEVCPKPHLLVWAKLKGFPFWPAKAMCTNSSGMVDVRFFGAHDRAWVHYKECYLFSEKDPNTFKQKRYDIERCVEELNVYIENLRKIHGEFRYAPYKTLIEPNNELKQLQIFLPRYKPNFSTKKRILNKAEAKAFPQDKKDTNIKNDLTTKENVAKITSEVKETENENMPPSNVEETKDPNEIKENIPESKIDEPSPTRNGTETARNGISSFQDDSIMEGYGTDDDTNPEIDLERRKIFIDRNTKDSSEKVDIDVEEEEDNDTQIPTNISLENSPVKSNKARDDSGDAVANNKSISRRTSDTDANQKRQSTEDMSSSPQKVSRRNSDQSVKSDSSRVSNISDKINRVDISENMEVTLGNDDGNVGCISISENISSNNSESSKSGSENNLESKKKPVQIDIENTEYTISPSNKLKISDKLMKRLSDGDEKASSASKAGETKKIHGEKKSPTDILIEKFKGVVDREIVDFGEPSTSSSCDEVSKKQSQPIQSSTPEETPNIISTPKEIPEKKVDDKPTSPSKVSEMLSPIEDIIQSVIKATNKLNEDKSRRGELSNKINKAYVQETNTLQKKTDATKLITQNDTMSIQKEIEGKVTNVRKEQNKECDKAPTENIEETKLSKINTPKEIAIAKDVSKKQDQPIQSSTPEITSPNKSVVDVSISNVSVDNTPKSITHPATNPEKGSHADAIRVDAVNPEVVNIIEEFEDLEEMETLNDLQIDKTNIFNIIHSSLSEAKEKENDKNVTPSTESSSFLTNTNSSSKKRKLSSNETSSSQAKIVKIVPIENILKKHVTKAKEITEAPVVQKSLQGKKMIREPSSASSTSSVSRRSSVQEIITEEIKSEPETDDDFSESENLEAKRKYLSALNISEKICEAEKKLAANEIRTRSKTEEKKERFRIVDNLTKTIDDVALNYSANHEGPETSLKKPDANKGGLSAQEGEIFVKSFARMQAPKQRARKSFPVPAYVKSTNQVSLLRKEVPPSVTVTKKDIPKSTNSSTAIVSTKVSTASTAPITQPQKTAEPISTCPGSRVILLPPNQTISCTSVINPVLSVVSPMISTVTTTSAVQTVTPTIVKLKPPLPNIKASQNYIPQNELNKNSTVTRNANTANSNVILFDILNKSTVSTPTEPEQTTETVESSDNTPTVEPSTDTPQDDEFSVLNSLLPENVSQAVSELLLRPPPRLKPRPPGMLSTAFDEGLPSSAGSATTKINSIAHRLGDYFRGMLIETLEDLGKSSSPEAKITSLQLEIEALKHRHNVELSEVRKNVCTILKDIQKSIVEDREKIIDETRAACETETIKRVELAKSKQWCANCTKEAQFYCCWNTSYCDYPCQQKHWPQHLGKCTQNVEKPNSTVTNPNRPSAQQLILRPAVAQKPGMGRIVAKPTKVYMNRTVGPPKTYKTLSTSGNHLTVIETTPGNYELVGNGPIAVTGKFLATTSNIFHSKFKTNVVTVTSPSTSGTSVQRNNPKITTTSDSIKSAIPASNISLPLSTVLDDDSD